MSTRTCLASLLAACLLAGCTAQEGDPLAAADAALAAQDYFTARDQALAALQADPGNAAALKVLARAQLAMGQGDNVLATLARLGAGAGESPEIVLLAAEAHLQIGDLARAEALIAAQDSAEAWRLRALVALARDDPAGAAEAFVRGRAAPGEKVRLYTAEASFLLDMGETEAAREPIALAQQEGPGRIETLFVTAVLAQQDADAELAARAFLAILERSALDRPALLGAINSLGALERMDQVRPLVARGLKAYPADLEFVFLAGLLKAQDKDWAGVRDLFQQHEGSLPDHPPSRGLYAQALLELGQINLARSHMVTLYRQFPGDPLVARTFARILLASGEKARAAEVIAPLAALPDALPQDRDLAALADAG